METNYLPLNEYSNKYKVSVSTLRRKIKSNEIAFRFEQGKYLLLDQVSRPSMNANEPRPSLKFEKDFLTSKDMRPLASFSGIEMNLNNNGGNTGGNNRGTNGHTAHSRNSGSSGNGGREQHLVHGSQEEPILTAANKLLTELKSAYTRILQEKEEQILHLKEEVSDLKTLVRVLESDNERLNKRMPSLNAF